jgi:copper transport protein
VIILLAAGFVIDLSPKEAVQGIYPKEQIMKGLTARFEASPLKPWSNDITIHLREDKDIKKVRAKFYTNIGGAKEMSAFQLVNGAYKFTGNFFHAAGLMNMEVQVIKKNGRVIIYPPFTFQVPGIMPNELEIENEG